MRRWMPTRDEWQQNELSVGQMVNRLWLSTELLATAFSTTISAPTPSPADARLDAGIAAAKTVATNVRDAVHAIPSGFTAANFSSLLTQMKILTDGLVSMLDAQAAP